MTGPGRSHHRTVLLVGAGDIAVASALELRSRGYERVHVLTRGRSPGNDAARRRLADAGYTVTTPVGDVADWASLDAAARAVAEPIGALVYAPAGARVFPAFDDLGQDQWQHAQDVFAGGLVGVVRAVRHDLVRGASVVALSGTSAHAVVSSRHLAMGSAKAAVERAVAYLAAELAGQGVRVNALACGPVETASVVSMLDPAALDELRAWQSAVTVPGRLARPADIGRIVAALCGADLEWVDGQVLLADGGASVRAGGDRSGTPLESVLDGGAPRS